MEQMIDSIGKLIICIKAAKLDHLSKLKVGWQKLKVDLESCWKVVSTEFESELADSDSVW